MLSREVPRGYRDDGRRDGCNGGGRREGGPACSGRATARWAVARTRKEAPGSRGSPRRTTVRGRPERDTPSDGAVGAVRGRSEGDTPRDGGASATAAGSATTSRGSPRRTTVRGRPEGDTPSDGGARQRCLSGAAGASASTSASTAAGAGAGAGAGASTGLTRFLWRQRE